VVIELLGLERQGLDLGRPGRKPNRAWVGPRAFRDEHCAVAESSQQQAEDRRAEPFGHPQDTEGKPRYAPKQPQRTVHRLPPRVKLCLTTIRAEAPDTCKRFDGRRGEIRESMMQTRFTIAALIVGFTIPALIVLSAITLGGIAGT